MRANISAVTVEHQNAPGANTGRGLSTHVISCSPVPAAQEPHHGVLTFSHPGHVPRTGFPVRGTGWCTALPCSRSGISGA